MKKAMAFRLTFWITCLPALFANIALAGSETSPIDFRPPDSDVSVKLLGYLFGLVDGVLHGTGSQIVGEMFGIFNSVVLVLASIIIMYSVFISIINTSSEGQILGKQWSSIWVPFRSIIGIAMLVPKASGYCTIQIFVMWVIVQGIGAADAVWGQALSYLQRGGVLIDRPTSQAYSTNDSLPKTCEFYNDVDRTLPFFSALLDLQNDCKRATLSMASSSDTAVDTADEKSTAATILRNLICMHSLEIVLKNKRAELLVTSGISIPPVPIFNNYLNTFDNNGAAKETILIPPQLPSSVGNGAFNDFAGVCGKITVTPITDEEIKTAVSDLEDVPGLYLDQDKKTLNTNHPIVSATKKSRSIALQQMISELSTTAQRIVSNVYYDETDLQVKYHQPLGFWVTTSGHKDWVGDETHSTFPMLTGYELTNAVNAYVALMRPTLRLLQGKMADVSFIEDARAQGWLLAGSYFYNLVKSTDEAGTPTTGVNSIQAQYYFSRTQLTNNDPSCRKDGTTGPCEIHYSLNGQAKHEHLGIDDFETSASPIYYCEYWGLPCGAGQVDLVEKYINSALQSRETNSASETSGRALQFTLPDIPKKTDNMFSCGFFLTDIINCILMITDRFILTPLINALIMLVNWIFVKPFSLILFKPIEAAGVMFHATIKATYEPGANPILELAKFGNVLQTISVDMILGLLIWCLFIVLIPPIMMISIPMLFIFGPIIFVLVGAMWSVGIVLAFYVPLIPYIVFTFASLGWFVSVIEAMVAAPLLALGLAHPDGQSETLGRSESGVLILTNVFLRPSLMIIGFIIAIILSYVVVILFNSGFLRVNEMLLDVTQDGFGSFLAPVFAIVFYVSIYMKLVEKCFDLIHILPDQVLTWIGGEREDVGARFGQGAGQELQQSVTKTNEDAKKVGKAGIDGAKKAGKLAIKVKTGGASTAAEAASSTGEN